MDRTLLATLFQRDMVTGMDLVPVTMGDLSLFEFLQTDPVTMSELGGPIPRDGLAEKLRGIVRDVAEDRVWYFTIHPDGPGSNAVGTVCIWD
ncbi:MAG TPA: hypothetical protein VKA30_12005, partial [Actinomycetota bacterium]|nr:hypothetical protein [Actinomycetota bacterium]